MEALAVIWAPVRVLTHVADERRVLLGFIVTALSAVLGLIGVLTVILTVVSPFITWLLVSGLMQLVTRFFGGDGPFSRILVVVGVAQVPSVIVGVIGIAIASLRIALGPESPTTTIVGLLGSLLGLAALLWFAALVVVGAASPAASATESLRVRAPSRASAAWGL